MMNKILMGEGKNLLNSGEYFIEYNKEIEIDINGEVIINSNSNSNLTLNITNNSNLKFYNLDMIKENRCIIINVYDNVELDYNLALINTGKNKCNIKVNILGNNSSVNIKVRVLNTDKQSKIDIICDGNINIKEEYPEQEFISSCLRIGLTISDLEKITYIEAMKILYSTLDKKENTKIRKATQADWDRLM